jgi:hypothetical protein
VLLLAMAGVAMGTVYVRSEQSRAAGAALRHEAKCHDLRRDLWAMQTRLARLRSPSQIHDRLGRLHVELAASYEKPKVPVKAASSPVPKASKPKAKTASKPPAKAKAKPAGQRGRGSPSRVD